MHKKTPPQNNYPQQDSPFFKLKSKRRLAELLGASVKQLRELLSKQDNYKIFPDQETGRIYQEPKDVLKRMHKRMQTLLNRIKTPDYLHSSIKGYSYLTNAKSHLLPETYMEKMDIRRFYPSTKTAHVYDFFRIAMACESDIAMILSEFCTYQGSLPTGSPLSPIMGFFAHKALFDKIDKFSKKSGFIFTCYVDDLTFSGEKEIPQLALNQIKHCIRQRGFIAHKLRRYGKSSFKIVTGVGIKNGIMYVPNCRKRKIHELMIASTTCEDMITKEVLLGKLVGRLSEASQIEPKYKGKKDFLSKLKNKIQKENKKNSETVSTYEMLRST